MIHHLGRIRRYKPLRSQASRSRARLGACLLVLEPLELRRLLAVDLAQLPVGGTLWNDMVSYSFGSGVIWREMGQAQALTMTEPISSNVQVQANATGKFKIELQKGPGLAANPQASAAFDMAAAYFESIFFDPITVVVDADIAPLGPGILGSTSSERVSINYDTLRDLMIADAATDETLVSQIPTFSQLATTLPVDDTNPFSVTGAQANRPLLKALGVAESTLPGEPSDYNPSVKKDMSMTFTTLFPWDFNPLDGIDPGKSDFVAVAIHEIGHGLGFTSAGDFVDLSAQFPDSFPRQILMQPLDMFRLHAGGGSTFSTATRALSPAEPAVFYDGGTYNPVGFNIPGIALGEIPLSTGRFTGDGNQASHWKADELTGVYIGIMDPSEGPSPAVVTAQDIRAWGLLGYDLTPAHPTVNLVGNVTEYEGDSGTVDFVFTVSVAGEVIDPLSVSFSTFSGTATSGIDFLPTAGTLFFLPGGPSTQTITVQAVGDTVVESNETFFVRLLDGTNVFIGQDVAIGTILNDDVDLSIGDITVVEGDSGTKNALFTVSTFGDNNRPISVSYMTLDNTARAGEDYQPRVGTLAIPPGGSGTITVPIVGDRLNEPTETFLVALTNPVNARIAKQVGIGTIIDNDPLPSFYVNDVFITTIYPGVLGAVFTVGLDTPSGQNVYVNYSTEDGLAKSGIDYQSAAGVLTFAPGVRTQQVTVPVMTSDVYSPNEKFYLNLSNPLNALMTDSQGVCTIVFAPPPINESIRDDGGPGYSQTAGWTTVTNTLAYELDYSYAAAGSGSAAATWSFNSLPAGEYQVFARWVPFSNWASNAPYTILDGNTARGTVQVNQRVAPAGELSNGVVWQSLGTFQINSNTLNVRLSNNANGYVVADAIRIVRGGISQPAPEIDVAGTLYSIATGQSSTSLDNGTDFGSGAAQIDSLVRTFTITNTGNAELHLSGNPRVAISGAHASDFTVLSQPAAVLAPGAATSFQVRFRPQAVGLRQATISIANNDSNESLYTFAIQGAGFAVGATQVTIDDSMAGFSQTGVWTNTANLQATGGQFRTSNPPQGAATATWTFFNLAPGSYDVYATWVPAGNLATNAPFGLADGNAPASTVLVNQQLQPGTQLNGKNWGQLGAIDVASGTLRVTLGNNANGLVQADAVMVVRHENAPAPLAHNQTMPLDVNGDARVSAFDALLVINSLNAQSDAGQAGPLTATAAPSYFLDVNGDGRVSAIDALMVINHLLNQPSAAPSAAPLAAEEPSAPDLLPLVGLDQALRADEERDEFPATTAWLLPTDAPEAGPIAANAAAANQVWEDVADESAADLADDDAWDSLLSVLAG